MTRYSLLNKNTVFMAPKCILILSSAVCILAFERLTYRELQELNATCPNDNCHEASVSYSRRTCECDDKCNTFQDCCINSVYVQEIVALNPLVYCLPFGKHNLFGISDCLPDWTGDDTIRFMCENVREEDEKRDPLLKLPVTDPKSTITYKNRFCAICNDVHDVISWQLNLEEVWTFNSYNMTYGNLTRDYVLRKMIFNEDVQNWGVWLYSHPVGWSFTSYEVKIELQNDLANFVRSCRISMVHECSANWSDEVVRQKCSAYQAAIYLMDKNYTVTQYRNAHCALCNYMNISKPICALPVPYDAPFLNFALILDFNTSGGNIVGSKRLCEEGEVFDPFSKKCRAMVCGLPGFKLENGKCVAS